MTNEFIREQEAARITGLSRTTRWRLEQRGDFPKRYQISDGIKAYRSTELNEWMESRPQEV